MLYVVRLVLEFDIIVWAFAKFPLVLWVWLCMKLVTILVVFPVFYFWANSRRVGPVCECWLTQALMLNVFANVSIGFVHMLCD